MTLPEIGQRLKGLKLEDLESYLIFSQFLIPIRVHLLEDIFRFIALFYFQEFNVKGEHGVYWDVA